jgi:pSer/pThr/pTyr-binding forkhead associated (FHA) protein
MPLHLVLEPVGPRIEVHRPDVIVGRHSEADVRLGLPDISRRHCRLVFEDQHWRVYDLSSLNGVHVNGDRMQEATLYHGDQLRLGTCAFIVEYAAPSADAGDDVPHGKVIQSLAEAMKEQKRAS